MMNYSQENFTPYYNPNYNFPSNPMPPHVHQHPRNRNRLPQRQNHNEEYWCETCDRGFYSLDILNNHKQQHQKCNVDGCQFIAHPKVITKHIQMQHASGLYNKIAKLNNPEEIQKWREERKKKYPTKVNIEKKAAEIKEKIDRGERMGLSKDRHQQFRKGNHQNKKFMNENNHHNNRQRQHSKPTNNNKSILNKSSKPIIPKKVNIVKSHTENEKKLKPFAGIQDIVMETSSAEMIEDKSCSFTIEDDDSDDIPKPVPENKVGPKVCGALSLLMCEYDSCDDESNEVNVKPILNSAKDNKEVKVETQIHNSSTTINVNKNNPEDNHNSKDDKSDDDAPEEIKIDKSNSDDTQTVKETPKLDESNKMKRKLPVEKKPNRSQFIRPKYKVPSTLLQKLLRREVQHERNIVLQCVRHIVKNNFFDSQ